MLNLENDARQLLNELDHTAISNTVYDTAWAARAIEGNGSSAPAFPETLELNLRVHFIQGTLVLPGWKGKQYAGGFDA
jgi:hypothetical protein